MCLPAWLYTHENQFSVDIHMHRHNVKEKCVKALNILLLTLPGEPTSTRCYIFIDRLFVLSSTMAALSIWFCARILLTYIGSDTEPRTAAMPRCLQNLTCLKYVCSSQWTSTLHTAKNAEHTVFPQTWLVPKQSSLQYGLQPKIQSFLLFKT